MYSGSCCGLAATGNWLWTWAWMTVKSSVLFQGFEYTLSNHVVCSETVFTWKQCTHLNQVNSIKLFFQCTEQEVQMGSTKATLKKVIWIYLIQMFISDHKWNMLLQHKYTSYTWFSQLACWFHVNCFTWTQF